jgi:hypothetical protein
VALSLGRLHPLRRGAHRIRRGRVASCAQSEPGLRTPVLAVSRAIPGAARRRPCRGDVRSGKDVTALRRFVGMTQKEFARRGHQRRHPEELGAGTPASSGPGGGPHPDPGPRSARPSARPVLVPDEVGAHRPCGAQPPARTPGASGRGASGSGSRSPCAHPMR